MLVSKTEDTNQTIEILFKCVSYVKIHYFTIDAF